MCQNWEISQVRPEQVRSTYLPPRRWPRWRGKAVPLDRLHLQRAGHLLSSTCSDTRRAGARRRASRAPSSRGGYIQPEPLKELCRHVDAIKVDLKAFSEKFYKEVVNGEIKPVLDALVTMRKLGMWTEIVYLVVPTLNDGDQEFRALARWVKAESGPGRAGALFALPSRVSAQEPAADTAAHAGARQGRRDAEGLHYVYIGNVPGHPAENTYCPKCRRAVVERAGFAISAMRLRKGKCRYCQQPIAGVWEVNRHETPNRYFHGCVLWPHSCQRCQAQPPQRCGRRPWPERSIRPTPENSTKMVDGFLAAAQCRKSRTWSRSSRRTPATFTAARSPRTPTRC